MTEWRTIPGMPYEASDAGDIRRIGAARPLRPAVTPSGYLQVNLWSDGAGRGRYVHRLVCEAFHGAPPQKRLDAAHRNGIRSDNRPANLRWATRAENEADKRPLGLANIGERNGGAKLTAAQVVDIRRRVASAPRSSGGKRPRKGSIQAIAADFGVTCSCIASVAARRLWRHVP